MTDTTGSTSSTRHADNPGDAVEDAVRRSLALVDTWIHWDGRPCVSEDGDRVYTPHKAVRRIADHLIDHLAEVEARARRRRDAARRAGTAAWSRSSPTGRGSPRCDRDEAHQRLPRLARTFALRLAAAGPDEWDRPRGDGWTLREIADHLTGVLWYAEQVGDLAPDGGQ